MTSLFVWIEVDNVLSVLYSVCPVAKFLHYREASSCLGVDCVIVCLSYRRVEHSLYRWQ